MKNEKVYQMKIANIYPLLVNKVVRKNRTQEEANEIICWLTGYSEEQLNEIVHSDMSYEEFFHQAPCLNENRFSVKGSICGVKIDEIEEPLMKDIRILDKMIDECAKGKAMEKILRVK